MMLANTLVHRTKKGAITVGEDVSGFCTLCRTIEDGGLGFDYRLGMALPDMWFKYLRDTPDEYWNMGHIAHQMTDRRWKEKVVAYSESHDQAIVGDKTATMYLFQDEVYTGMAKNNRSIVVDRGVALNKMIKVITFNLGGEAYLNFMGNEYGHPEWIDFPRDGNNWCYDHCRRQWSLNDNQDLYYSCFGEFDRVMNEIENIFNVMQSGHQWVSLACE